MRRYATLSMVVVGAMLVLFLLAEALRVPLLTDAEPLGSDRGLLAAAAIGVALLIADVFLPVPSSVVMVANGALFGVVLGTALSLVGSVGAFAVGFGVGRRGSAVVARFVPADERERADRFFDRWGIAAVISSRPVPILAETVSFVAGTSVLGWRPAMGAATVGSVPAAILYAVAGSLAAGFASTSAVFGVVILLGIGSALVIRQRSEPHGGSL